MPTPSQNPHTGDNMTSRGAKNTPEGEAEFALYLSQRFGRKVSAEEATRVLSDWARYFAVLERIDQRTGGKVGMLPLPVKSPTHEKSRLPKKPADATVDPVSLPFERPNNLP